MENTEVITYILEVEQQNLKKKTALDRNTNSDSKSNHFPPKG